MSNTKELIYMLKNITGNKKILVGVLSVLLIAVGAAMYLLGGDDSETSKKTPTSNIEVESEDGLDVVEEDENVPEEESPSNVSKSSNIPFLVVAVFPFPGIGSKDIPFVAVA